MRVPESNATLSAAVRRIFALATFAFLGAGFVVDQSTGLFVAAGVFATMWWAWDLLVEYVFDPIEAFGHHLLQGGATEGDPSVSRPSLDDTVRLLENHLANPTSAKVDINAAIRLEEIYRTVQKDAAKAEAVIRTVRGRYPEAPELQRFRDQDDESSFFESI